MKRIDKYLYSLNLKDKLINKVILISGASGSLASSFILKLVSLYLDISFKLILIDLDILKLKELKNKINQINQNIEVIIYGFDASNIKSLDEVILKIKEKNNHLDYVYLTHGVYHLPYLILKDSENKKYYERTYLINYYSIIYLMKKLKEITNKFIIVISLSYRYVYIDYADLYLFNKNISTTKRYGITKRYLLLNSLYLNQNEGYNINLIHPGVSATSLFDSSKGGFKKAFNKLITPIMKKIFPSNLKASLSFFKALNEDKSISSILGPHLFFNIYGYPKNVKIKTDLNNEDLKKIDEMVKI